ncbi:elongin-A [Pelobates fuscus]|uniref:elongin-A n=1 Tax=Pelobates fuscus TaxID=191477 RepID=UPI002FE472CC
MADSVLEVVGKLQSRLSLNAEPKKLHKTLKRLAELPITVDILVETGVGKTVNGLRKHEIVGDFAKNLVAQWKKLVPQDAPRAAEPEERESSKCSARKRPRSPSPSPREDYDEEEIENEEELQSYHQRDERHRTMSGSHSNFRKEEGSCQRYSEQEESDDGQSYSPEPSHSPVNLYKEKTHHKPGKQQKSSHRDKHQQEAKNVEPERKKEKSSSKEAHRDHSSFAGSSRDKLTHESREQSGKKEKSKHSGSRSQGDDQMEVKKQKHLDKSKSEKPKLSVDIQPVEKSKKLMERDEDYSGREKIDKNKVKSKTVEQVPQEKKSIKISLPSTDQDLEDEFEKPQMSFESYLSYDQPQKKKKKPVVKPSATTPNKNSKKPSESRAESTSKGVSKPKSEPAVAKKDKTSQKPVTSNKIDQVPVLPDIALPLIQPNYRPLPSIEPVVYAPTKRKAISVLDDDESSGFTGKRLNSKMQVYSGSKTAYLPKMMSLYQQCIRVLANNIDSIYEVGGVPYSVLEPVLEKCTPEQLYRIEEHNHVLTEDTDRLWMNHCQRDFKKDNPEEFESWRELYLRLHEAREERLRLLTQNIRSAHANKPRGRQAKMAFVDSAVKPPRDVRRRQEKFGTGAAAVPEKMRFKPFTPVTSSSSGGNSSSSNQVSAEDSRSFEGPSTSSTSSTPSSVQHGHNPRKPQVKKVAPMMAKTIQAFKNRFSRR